MTRNETLQNWRSNHSDGFCLHLFAVGWLHKSGGTGTAKAIKVGFNIPFTGPAAEKGQPIGQGELDAMKYINDELGGVNGNKIDVVWYDTKYDSNQATTNAKKLMADGCAFFTAVSSKDAVASQKVANDNGFPCLVVFSSPSLTHPPAHMYAQLPDYGDDWAAFTKYYMQNIWKGNGKPKMALEIAQ